MTVNEAIRKRRSIRKFKPDAEATDEQVKLLLEAAMLAPSACNTRPWEFVVVKDVVFCWGLFHRSLKNQRKYGIF